MDVLSESHSVEQAIVHSRDSVLGSDAKNFNNQSQKPRSQQTTELFGIGPAICTDDATITGCRLPTSLQVLQYTIYHRNIAVTAQRPGAVGATSRFTTAKLVLQQISAFYENANIPVVSEHRTCEKIVKLLDDNNKLRAASKARRDTPAANLRLEESRMQWPPNVES
jgi:hypothetical protein